MKTTPFILLLPTLAFAQPTTLTVTDAGMNGQCDGSLTVDGMAGNWPSQFTYLWTGPGGTFTTPGPTANGLCAGDYTVVVTNSFNCQAVVQGTVAQCQPLPDFEYDIEGTTGQNTNDGFINLHLSSRPDIIQVDWWTLSWNGTLLSLGLGDNQHQLRRGTYWAIITYGNGCRTLRIFNVDTQEAMCPALANLAITPACPGMSNGAIHYTTRGQGPFLYDWVNTGQTTEDLTDIPAGNYQLYIETEAGCAELFQIEVPEITIPYTVTPSCDGQCNGTIQVNPPSYLNFNPDYLYEWGTSNHTSLNTGLCPGSYPGLVLVKDDDIGYGCIINYGPITVPSLPAITLNAVTRPACPGQSNGAAFVIPAGGESIASWLWSTGSRMPYGQMGLPNGTHRVDVIDVNGCTASREVVIETNDIRAYYMPGSSGQSFCSNMRNIPAPTISETPWSANQNYTYLWSNGAVTPSLQNMPPGTYTVNVTSSSGCTTSTSYTWYRNTNIMPVNLNLLGKPCYQWTQSMHSIVDTFDFSTYGYLEVTANGFNNQGESYRWTCPNTGSPSSGQGVLNGTYLRVPSGNFSITVTSSSGCETIKQMYIPKGFINDITPLVFDACSNTTLGQINFSNLSHMNASPSRPVYTGFDYEWYDQNGNRVYANHFPSHTIYPPPGTYTVVSRDINSDCVSTSRNYTINATPLEIAGNRVRGNTCFDEIPWATRDGLDGLGAALYTYSFTPNDRGLHGETWTRNGSSIPSLGIGAITRDRYPIDPGHYCMTLHDVRGCTAEDCFTVNDGEYGTNVSCPYTYHYCDFGNGTNFLGTTQTGNPILQTDPVTCNAWYQCGDVRGPIYYGSPSSATNGVAINPGRSGVWYIPYNGGFWRDAQHGNTLNFSLSDLPSCNDTYLCQIEEGINLTFPGYRGPPIQTYDTLDQSLSDRCNFAGRQVNIYCKGNWIGYYCIAQPRLALPSANTPDGFSIYPNPFDKHIVVEFGNDKPVRYRIMDIVGTFITDKGFRLQGNEGKAFIHDLADYPAGSYILDITFESGNQVSSLIIKQ